MDQKSLLFRAAFVALFLFSLALFHPALAQENGASVSGTVNDDKGEPLAGATIALKGTGKGTTADGAGKFTLTGLPTGSQTIIISFIGFDSQEIARDLVAGENSLGNLSLAVNAAALSEVVVVGVADYAKERQTPVAVSTVRATEIQTKLGNQEFPEILRTTPSVYATKSGGGFGDSRINIRGFDQNNVAVLINGVPVNDMEGGTVYWSNWAGLSDVTSALQVQRGLGSSKLAIASVGGTMNVITKTTDMKQSGSASVGIGNDGYNKFNLAYNTGLTKSGWSVSALISRTSGKGYVDGTKFEGYNYFLGIGYKPNAKNDFQFVITGAPQWHHQRSTFISLATYQKYGSNGEPNTKYNSDWGYLNGDEYNVRRNYYHKPVASINWEHKINSRMSLSSVVYASWGRGGGTGPTGSINGKAVAALPKTTDGLIRFDDIASWSAGDSVTALGKNNVATNGQYINTTSKGITRYGSINSHDWYGAIIKLNTKLTDAITWDLGVDLRTYKGIHYRVVTDVLGADGYLDNTDVNNPNRVITKYYDAKASFNPFVSMKDQQKMGYYNDGLVRWGGLFTQLEYSKNNLSVFVQGSLSNQAFRRIDYFVKKNDDPLQKSDWSKLWGGTVKGGANYNIDDHSNVFANAGFYSKQPLFNSIFPNNAQTINPNIENEKILGTEVGYGFRSKFFNLNLNLYRTSWADRFLRATVQASDGTRGIAYVQSLKQVHTGVELEANTKLVEGKLEFRGMLSLGNWKYSGNGVATYVDEATYDIKKNPDGSVFEQTLYLDGVKVGDAAQTTASLEGIYEIVKGLKVNATWFYMDNLYASFAPADFAAANNKGALKLPSYNLFDAGINYKLSLSGRNALIFGFNINNLFDTQYIAEAKSNLFPDADSAKNWKGINTANTVYFGFGRTWNASIKYNF
ncbi:Vitamin B12 transporter BtuB [Dyadobacter sp. CECT 9275]|uniref:Vitamin B12 transporter BtuB n=1 Tax=Dyadobacter helix TaxID=2822344 RepID=A0A916J8J8_9BACT|nr:TonB-dependent receptor [Dyadobacter sp. CECT 9275]CAG4993796.1 Vitamin B12 transporter BtuB [Dyadobacter sp. CECT 9275]